MTSNPLSERSRVFCSLPHLYQPQHRHHRVLELQRRILIKRRQFSVEIKSHCFHELRMLRNRVRRKFGLSFLETYREHYAPIE